MPRLHSGGVIDRPETTKLPPIAEVVWQQHQKTHLIDVHKNPTINIKGKNDVQSQISPIRETSSQISGPDTEMLLGDQTRSTPVNCPNDSKKQQPEIQQNETDMTTYDIGDDNIFPPKKRLHKVNSDL